MESLRETKIDRAGKKGTKRRGRHGVIEDKKASEMKEVSGRETFNKKGNPGYERETQVLVEKVTGGGACVRGAKGGSREKKHTEDFITRRERKNTNRS